jgi:predicted site-specific integrase-resolvase
MARKSRKENAAAVVAATEKSGYRTAIYVRLSHEDERKIESESVENQIAFLKDFIGKDESLTLLAVYADRNVSGTKFDRPQFNQMITDIRSGDINCVVVKDLSRLGRNYLEAGDYTGGKESCTDCKGTECRGCLGSERLLAGKRCDPY